MKNLEIRIKNIYNSLDRLRAYDILSETEWMKIKKIMEVMEKRIRSNEKPGKKEGRQIEETIDMVLKIAINRPITPDFRKLVDNFVSLINYWNDKVGGQSALKNSISAFQKFVDYHLTVQDAIVALRDLISRMERIKNFTPPAFELSKYYLESLESSRGKKGGNAKKKNSR